jgi:hypothetical protein
MSIHARREPRHAFEAVVRLQGSHENATAEGLSQDLSRRGIRVRMTLSALRPDAPRFAEVLESIREHFGRGATVLLPGVGNHGGRTLAKDAIVVRLVSEANAEGCLDVGLLFLDPLTEEEVALIGAPNVIAVPGDDAADRELVEWEDVDRALTAATTRGPSPRIIARGTSADADATTTRRLVARPKQRHMATIEAIARGGMKADGYTEMLTPEAVLVRLPGAAIGDRGEIRSLSDVAASFSDLYGERIRLVIGPGAAPLWRGWGRLGGFEAATEDAADVVVLVALERTMDAEARVRVGLDSRPR